MTTRKADPYEARARELCFKAGVNPEARVPKEGDKRGRTMPAWCMYRQAARDEHIRSEFSTPAVNANSLAPCTVLGQHEWGTLEQMAHCLRYGNSVRGVLCADGHLGYAQPVGGVIAYRNQVSISGVGFDIACGNKAARLDIKYEDIADDTADIARKIAANVSFGVGRSNAEKVEASLFDLRGWWEDADMLDYRSKASAQLGTVGSGNHYIVLFHDESGQVWIGVHFGSRGLGHTTASRYLKRAGGKDGVNVAPTIVDVGSDIGRQYLQAMGLAGAYAYAGRDWVVNKVASIVGGEVLETVHNHHNFAWEEHHGGEKLWVVRKGATPAFPGQRGFVGGSMGDNAVILEGVESLDSAAALYSTVHGAGRVFGRKEAKRRFSRDEMEEWLKRKKVYLIGGDLDESPMAYRRLPDVLGFHQTTVRIVHTLTPFVVLMAGSGEVDPWKD